MDLEVYNSAFVVLSQAGWHTRQTCCNNIVLLNLL